MNSRYLFRKSTLPWYMHRRWLLASVVLPVVVMKMVWSNDHRREEWVWQSPIEPPGVTIVSHAAEVMDRPVDKLPVKEFGRRALSVADSGVVRLTTYQGQTAAKSQDETLVRQAIERWSAAWSARDVKGYLKLYAKSFEPAGGQSRGDWVKNRYQRILSKKHISHSVQNLEIRVSADVAIANFEQAYEADKIRQIGPKTLHLTREDGTWRITSESTH